MHPPKIIHTEEEYDAALAHVEPLMDAKSGSTHEEELEIWTLLIESYEEAHHPIPPPDPVEAIRFRMEQIEATEHNVLSENLIRRKSPHCGDN